MPAVAMKRAGGARKGRVMPVFGRSLEDVYAEGGGLPPVFWDTLRLLSLKALTTPGLFRPHAVGRSCSHSKGSSGSGPERTCSSDSISSLTSGDDSSDPGSSRECSTAAADDGDGQNSGRKVLLCKRLYDSGQDALKVLPSTSRDLHAVAGILKLWVSSLPEPVIPPRLYDAALGTQTAHADRDAQVAALHGLLRQCEHRVLQVLFPLMEGAEHPDAVSAVQFLHHYCLNQPRPARERQELARIFAPMLLRPAGCSVMAPSHDKKLVAACVEHMIREYRTLFIARKRAIVPPTVPSPVSTAPSLGVIATAAAAAAVAAGLPAAPGSTSSASAAVTADASATQAAESSPQHSGRQLAPLKVSYAGTDCGVTAHSIDDLPDSGSDASSDTDAGLSTDAGLEEALTDLLFSSTCALFAEQPGTATQLRDFFATSPGSSPDNSPVRRPQAAAAVVDSSSAGVADMDADGMAFKKAEGCLSPTSVPDGWAAMSDGESSAGSDGGSGDEAAADTERICGADVNFGMAAPLQHIAVAMEA